MWDYAVRPIASIMVQSPWRTVIAGFMVVLCLAFEAPSQAGQWVYTKIADTLTPTPQGNGGAYNYFGEAPAWNGERVVFSGEGTLYEFDPATGTSRYLTGINTPIPGGDGVFQGGFGGALVDQGKLVIRGGGLNGQKGVYLYDQGVLERIVDLNTPIPDGNGGFTKFSQFNEQALAAEGGRIAIAGRDLNGRWGIFLYDNGTISRVVDTTTAIPGGTGTFGLFQGPALRGEQLLFQGSGAGGQLGLYVADSDGVQLIAKSTELAPGYPFPVPFLALPYYGWQGETPTFASGVGNVYQWENGLAVPQIDPLGSLPGLVVPDVFYANGINGLATDATGFAVTGLANDFDTGIWLSSGGILEMVIGPNAVLDGVTIAGADGEPAEQFPDPFVRFAIGPQAVNGRSVVFRAAFEGSDSYRQGLYIATYVPEPAAWLLAGLGCLAWLALRSMDRARFAKPRAKAHFSRRLSIRVSLNTETRALATPTIGLIEALEGRQLLSANLNELSWVSGVAGTTSNPRPRTR